MEDNNTDADAGVARSLLDARLDLKYVEVFNSGKAVKIVACTIALTLAILFLNFSSSQIEFIIGGCSLLVAIRLVLGAPTEIRLTDESLLRLQSWLLHDEGEADGE